MLYADRSNHLWKAEVERVMNKPLPSLDRPPSLHVSVQQAIRSYIIDNNLQPGDPLPPETQLGKQLGVSRNSVREAVRSLESLGILETRRGSGLFVSNFSFEPLLDNLHYGLLQDLHELRDIFEVRQVLETNLIARVVDSISDEQISALADVVKRMQQRAERGEVFPEVDREFHQRLFENLGNKTLLRLLDIFWLTFHNAAKHVDIWDNDPAWTYQAHAAILDAVRARDASLARTRLDEHYNGLAGRLTRVQGE
jgi:DNA-binding FadR family transcriptional regulator